MVSPFLLWTLRHPKDNPSVLVNHYLIKHSKIFIHQILNLISHSHFIKINHYNFYYFFNEIIFVL